MTVFMVQGSCHSKPRLSPRWSLPEFSLIFYGAIEFLGMRIFVVFNAPQLRKSIKK